MRRSLESTLEPKQRLGVSFHAAPTPAGTVASTLTIWRVLAGIDAAMLAQIRQGRRQTRRQGTELAIENPLSVGAHEDNRKPTYAAVPRLVRLLIRAISGYRFAFLDENRALERTTGRCRDRWHACQADPPRLTGSPRRGHAPARSRSPVRKKSDVDSSRSEPLVAVRSQKSPGDPAPPCALGPNQLLAATPPLEFPDE